MKTDFNISRFLSAQNLCDTYQTALQELLQGEKQSHWIWFILPQLKGLGFSDNAQYYGLDGIEEARLYLENQTLAKRLRQVCEIMIQWAEKSKSMNELLGYIDAMKACSCLTLFDVVAPNSIFAEALQKCFHGKRDEKTLEILKNRKN